MTMTTSKINPSHLTRQACIDIRQSTPGQVRFNQESTERQYNLMTKARAFGWGQDQIRVLDGDLGQSGSAAGNRGDFKILVSDVALGQVGAIFSLEASRLARSNQDWHRLLELCAITNTLVVDEDGVYAPAEFNDSLVLGMKGAFAQAELHIIRARLHGGKLNKAAKGELHFPLPVGFVFEGDKIVLDPDQEVQGAVRMIFSSFQQAGSAFGVVRRFQELGSTLSAALLWWRVGWEAHMGTADPLPRDQHPAQSLLCRRLRLRTLSICQRDRARWRDHHPVAPRAAGGLAGDDPQSSPRLY